MKLKQILFKDFSKYNKVVIDFDTLRLKEGFRSSLEK